jgi:hypothetical protein
MSKGFFQRISKNSYFANFTMVLSLDFVEGEREVVGGGALATAAVLV